MEECLPYKQEVGGLIPLYSNDISILIFLIKYILLWFIMAIGGFQTFFVFFYEGGSKPPSYVTTRQVQNFPCKLQWWGFKNPPVGLYEGGS